MGGKPGGDELGHVLRSRLDLRIVGFEIEDGNREMSLVSRGCGSGERSKDQGKRKSQQGRHGSKNAVGNTDTHGSVPPVDCFSSLRTSNNSRKIFCARGSAARRSSRRISTV